ncbi:thiamine diphosphate-binding protein [Polychytrium aggregatum]|uniref:thiamine diphosphate-binding protein n=1 Tax=Polychytrium aggregatum TaxID=110093 RepID=UPI0022FDEAC3|nr:thiamine diphosphate-binding protein [Polychytrium aggregatum]KAI9209482.1 thiamine diphosphate-binding protein [Polychytrium aggregatum]
MSSLSKFAIAQLRQGVRSPLRKPSTLRNATLASLHRPVAAMAFHTSTAAAQLSQSDTFLNGSSASYIEEMYGAWLQDPKSVHLSWQVYFKNLKESGAGLPAFIAPPNIIPGSGSSTDILGTDGTASLHSGSEFGNVPQDEIMDHMKVQLLVRAYQIRGHHLANLDPLEIGQTQQHAPELDYSTYGFTEKDLDREFFLGSGILPRFITSERKKMTLRQIIDALKATYASTIAIEYGHISDRTQCDWLRQRFEVPNRYTYSKERKQVILDRLMWSHNFEHFVATKYPSEKRFGLEGCESLIPGMKALIDRAVENGVNSVVMGMPHRGRLNVLSNVVRKPNQSIFCEFAGSGGNHVEGSGDVKYHLGMRYTRPTPSGRMVELSLVANPSHLEAVNPVVHGKVRATQFYEDDEAERSKSLAVLLHGDASFAAQGVVYETLGFSDLPAYSIGGSIHIIVNNQIGFTTDPRFARSTPYCSDVAKTVAAPIIHVNGDDVEAVVYAMELAADWRATFKKDVVIDIVCYRKHGHNEVDQPQFTQPLMYQKIAKMEPVISKYSRELIAEGSITQEVVDAMKTRVWDILEDNYTASKTYQPKSQEWVSSAWPGMKAPAELAAETVPSKATGLDYEILKFIGTAAASYPSDFTPHSNLAKILKQREKSVIEGEGIDWATAESMAFGSLLAEGNHVRLSGQDVERGTFSQRHALLHDQNNETYLHVPLNNLADGKTVSTQSHFTVCNSSLSEFGTLGFELGYSMAKANQLILWEAQFGDFANNAQCIIDQFISSGEQKWLQRTGLTMLLPHGYDGQGPEHSSARIERYLQLIDEDPYKMPDRHGITKGSYSRQHQDCNMQVVYPTVPSNYFHVLRRQVHREFRKPLIVFASKALLRHPLAKSSIEEMGPGTRFQRVIPEVLHPNPLVDLDNANAQQSEPFVASGNNVEPRVPLALVSDAQYPPQVERVATGTVKSDSFTLLPPNQIKTIIFCSGQVYYQLFKTRAMNNLRDIAIVRLEQLSPFPFWEVKAVVDSYGSSLKEIVWCQEEAANSGSWTFVEPRLETAIRETDWYKSDLVSPSPSPSAESHPPTDNRSLFSRIFGGSTSADSPQPVTVSPAHAVTSKPKTKGRDWVDRFDSQRVAGGLTNARELKEGEAKSFRGGRLVRYAGRDFSAAPSTGIKKQHIFEERMLLSEALMGGRLIVPASVSQGVPVFEATN